MHYNTRQHAATHAAHCNTCNTQQHTAAKESSFMLSSIPLRALQCTATRFSTLQHMQHTATHCSKRVLFYALFHLLESSATYGNTLQHTATHCNTLQHTIDIQCLWTNVSLHSMLRLTLICSFDNAESSLDFEYVYMSRMPLNKILFILNVSLNSISRFSVISTLCSTLQHTATHCNTLQHTTDMKGLVTNITLHSISRFTVVSFDIAQSSFEITSLFTFSVSFDFTCLFSDSI